MWAIATLEACAAFHVIPADNGVTILTGVSGSESGWIALGYARSSWGVACLSEVTAALRRPALGQAYSGSSLGCPAAAFYVLCPVSVKFSKIPNLIMCSQNASCIFLIISSSYCSP